MSYTLITSVDNCAGVPRLSEASYLLVDQEPQHAIAKEFFCTQGHDFTLYFEKTACKFPIWECAVCETVALDFPPGISSEDYFFEVHQDILRETLNTNFESEEIDQEYVCENEHVFEISFSARDDIPETWSCIQCGSASSLLLEKNAVVV